MLKAASRILLAARVAVGLLRYDLRYALGGFRGVREAVPRPAKRRRDPDLEKAIPKAVTTASSFYWKPVLCLQRSVVTAHVMRKYGLDAEVVIGCRLAPFVGHAWVEVDGRVVNDTSGYQSLLSVLERF